MSIFESLVIRQYRYWTLYLSPYQCYLGRCYLALNREGNLDPFLECTNEEWEELRLVIKEELSNALAHLFAPDTLNYDNLRNAWPHCHWHIVPRYSSKRIYKDIEFTDTNWGNNWSPYDKEFFVPYKTLIKIRDDIYSELNE